MGNRLSPVTDKTVEDGTSFLPNENNGKAPLAYAACGMQGRRSTMEDTHLAVTNLSSGIGKPTGGDDDGDDDDDDDDDSDNDARDESTTNNKWMTDEQRHFLQEHSLFAVFDGHGGASAAKFASKNLIPTLLKQQAQLQQYFELMKPYDASSSSLSPKQQSERIKNLKSFWTQLFQEVFVQLDRELLLLQLSAQKSFLNDDDNYKNKNKNDRNHKKIDKHWPDDGVASRRRIKDSGTTVLVVIVVREWLVCANAGDCRAFYMSSGIDDTTAVTETNQKNKSNNISPRLLVPLSQDHKPSLADEERRIMKAGGFVFGGRIEDDLAVSRGLGDYRFKDNHISQHGTCTSGRNTPGDQKVSPLPDVQLYQYNNKSKNTTNSNHYLFLGCDGVFEKMATEKVARVLATSLTATKQRGDDYETSPESRTHSGSEGNGNGNKNVHNNRWTGSLTHAMKQLLDKSLRKGSKDNMTGILVQLP